MSAPEVRLAGPADADAVAGLLIGFRNWSGRSWPPDESFRATVRRLVAQPDTEFLLAAPARGARMAGVAQLRFRWSVWTESEDCWLEDLFVEEAARRAGLGEALVRAAVDRARARGCRRIELDVEVDNGPARALYERAGFGGKGASGSLFLGRRIAENLPPDAR